MNKDQIEALPTLELEALVNSTKPDGLYGKEFVLARDELARRLLNGRHYKRLCMTCWKPEPGAGWFRVDADGDEGPEFFCSTKCYAATQPVGE